MKALIKQINENTKNMDIFYGHIKNLKESVNLGIHKSHQSSNKRMILN